jgi:catechol 2,3-dioxygenase-like lactoylglutathione lyase family enzyme
MPILRRVARNVTDLEKVREFYARALGFVALGGVVEDDELAKLLGVSKLKSQRMQLGAQQIELTQCFPPGADYPKPRRADDIFFQHIAVVTTDIFAACARAGEAGAVPISSHGPQLLPRASGGVTAWKFRDPDGHPLEFLAFPDDKIWSGDALFLGYDHSGIAVADAERSIAFYTYFGLGMRHRQVNYGPEQERLDGVKNATLDVVAMAPQVLPPHVELLGYRNAGARKMPDVRPSDTAADRLVFATADRARVLKRDPDGHYLLLDSSA